MEFLLIAILLGLIPAAIAKGKGRSFFGWWVYGAALFLIALPHALIMKPNVEGLERQQREEGMKKCPFCAEMVKRDAIVCRYCGRDLPPKDLPPKEMMKECPGCHQQIPDYATGCRFCGHRF